MIGRIEEVRLVVADPLIACHPRHWSKEHTELNPVDYLALPDRKSAREENLSVRVHCEVSEVRVMWRAVCGIAHR